MFAAIAIVGLVFLVAGIAEHGYENSLGPIGRVRATYGKSYDRLAKVKKRYDPANLFRVNQNIAPAK